MELDDKTKEKLGQLQMFEQNINTLIAQKQQFQAQLLETESALSEVKGSDKAYRIIGNIMVLSESDKITKELTSKKEMLEIRIKTLDKQEGRIREKAKGIQEEVMGKMKSDKND